MRDYDQQFEVLAKTTTKNALGVVSTTDGVVYRGFAYIKPLGNTEFWQAAALQQSEALKLFCRWNEVFRRDPRELRIKWRNEKYSVVSIENTDSRNEQCVIRMERDDG